MDIVILGAGVAGVASAIALSKKGFRVRVYERTAGPATIGAGIVIWPNAAFVLEQLGVLSSIHEVSGKPAAMRRFSNTGEVLGFINIDRINQRAGYASRSILRTDFQNILLARLDDFDVPVMYSHTATSIKDGPKNKVQINFENGALLKADCVLGADGRMSSAARQYVLIDNKPMFQKFINWIGVFQSNDKVFDDISIFDYWGVGERFGLVPVSPYCAYWAAGAYSETISEKKTTSHKQEVSDKFHSWPGTIANVILETPEERINKIYVHDHNPVKPWHRSNVLLIGDAAHAPLPTSGQGACQALEDAWHLANCMERNPSDLTRAFSEFTAMRYDKTRQVTESARQLAASLFNTDPEYCRVRDEKSRLVNYDALADSMATFWMQGLPLPRYN